MDRRQVLRAISGAVLAAPLAGTVLGAGPAAAADKPGAMPHRTGFGAQLQGLLDAEHTAGMPGTFARVRQGGRSYEPAAGVADIATGEAVRARSLHRIGGVTKSFVAAVVLQLVGEGRIRLDAPIGRYLPHVVPGARGQAVTVRMLLNQTSGIDDYEKVLFATQQGFVSTATRTFQPIELVRMGLALPQVDAPGNRWSYANTNYVILGMLIEKTTGRPYGHEVERRVLRRLGLDDTSLPGTDPHIHGPHMHAYVPMSDGTMFDATKYNMSWAWAAGEIISTAADLNRFYAGLLGGCLLEPALLREMKTTVPFDASTPDLGGYGLGVYWVAGPCGRTWGHNGEVIGHTTYSTHSEDGSTLQLTQAESMNFYEAPNQQGPIDAARQQFQGAVLSACGASSASPGVPSASRVRALVGTRVPS